VHWCIWLNAFKKRRFTLGNCALAGFIAPRAVALEDWNQEEEEPLGRPLLSVFRGEYLAILGQEAEGFIGPSFDHNAFV
jgi:hypothetical protein